MGKTVAFEIDADEVQRLQSLVDELLKEMQQANLRMDRSQLEIDRLKADTRVMLGQIRQMMAS